MLTDPLEMVAARVADYLSSRGAEVLPEFGNVPRNYVTVEEICIDNDISYPDDWRTISNYMRKNGYRLTYKGGRGRGTYLGGPGEEIYPEFVGLRRDVKAAKRLPERQKRMREIAQAKGDAWKFLQSTYGITDPDQLEADTVKRINNQNTEEPLNDAVPTRKTTKPSRTQ